MNAGAANGRADGRAPLPCVLLPYRLPPRGINATRLFSPRYHRLLNIGRVMTPTLTLLLEREAQIRAFHSTPFYTVQLDCGSLTVDSWIH